MAIKRSKAPTGTVVILEHQSRVLRDNAWGDPHVRKLAVWLPPQYDQAAGSAALKQAGRDFRSCMTWSASPVRAFARRMEGVFVQRARARCASDLRRQNGAGNHRDARLLHGARR